MNLPELIESLEVFILCGNDSPLMFPTGRLEKDLSGQNGWLSGVRKDEENNGDGAASPGGENDQPVSESDATDLKVLDNRMRFCCLSQIQNLEVFSSDLGM